MFGSLPSHPRRSCSLLSAGARCIAPPSPSLPTVAIFALSIDTFPFAGGSWWRVVLDGEARPQFTPDPPGALVSRNTLCNKLDRPRLALVAGQVPAAPLRVVSVAPAGVAEASLHLTDGVSGCSGGTSVFPMVRRPPIALRATFSRSVLSLDVLGTRSGKCNVSRSMETVEDVCSPERDPKTRWEYRFRVPIDHGSMLHRPLSSHSSIQCLVYFLFAV